MFARSVPGLRGFGRQCRNFAIRRIHHNGCSPVWSDALLPSAERVDRRVVNGSFRQIVEAELVTVLYPFFVNLSRFFLRQEFAIALLPGASHGRDPTPLPLSLQTTLPL